MVGSYVLLLDRLKVQGVDITAEMADARVMHGATLSVSESDLLPMLRDAGVYRWDDDPMLALFQQHFLVRHSFYRLQEQLVAAANGLSAAISPIGLTLQRLSPTAGGSLNIETAAAELSAFYGDARYFLAATPETVVDLLASFWTRFHASEGEAEALMVLGLDAGANWQQIQDRYRELAQQHHPDKQGDAASFQSVREAYLTLKRSTLKRPR